MRSHSDGTDYVVEPTVDEDGVQASSGIGVDGLEYPDPVPMAPPVGWNAPPTMAQFIRQFVRQELVNRELANAGFETFDEADDLDIPDDLDPHSSYEDEFEPLTDEARSDIKSSLGQTKETDDGKSSFNKGRVDDSNVGDGQSDKVKSGKSKSEQKSDNDGSVPKADRRVAGSEE